MKIFSKVMSVISVLISIYTLFFLTKIFIGVEVSEFHRNSAIGILIISGVIELVLSLFRGILDILTVDKKEGEE